MPMYMYYLLLTECMVPSPIENVVIIMDDSTPRPSTPVESVTDYAGTSHQNPNDTVTVTPISCHEDYTTSQPSTSTKSPSIDDHKTLDSLISVFSESLPQSK